MDKTISIIGCGAVGTALGRALREKGWHIAALASRTKASAQAAHAFIGEGTVKSIVEAARSGDIILITTPDTVIEPVCAGIAEADGFRNGQVVLHCTGGLTSEALASARKSGAVVGSLHPLQSFSNPEEASRNLTGIAYTFEGHATAQAAAREIVRSLSGTLFVITADVKPLYHAASVIAANYLVALADMSTTILAQCGIPSEQALAALIPLMRGAVNNLERIGLPDALTGPIARGDLITVEKHIAALREAAPEMLAAYCHLGLRAVDVARFKGRISPEQADQINQCLRGALASE